MKDNKKSDKIRRNVDLTRKAIIILQWNAIALGHGTIKPYLEAYLENHAQRILVKNPALKKFLVNPKHK
jgi:hypothetical protein